MIMPNIEANVGSMRAASVPVFGMFWLYNNFETVRKNDYSDYNSRGVSYLWHRR